MKQLIDGWVITSNMKPISLKSWNELPKKGKEWFDYVHKSEKDEPRFFSAYGSWYDISDFVLMSEPIGPWVAASYQSMSSALFIQIVNGDKEIVGYGYYNG